MNEQEQPSAFPSQALRFEEMAARVKHNARSRFGGAAVIVPPEGDPIEILILDSSGDPAQFIATLVTRLKQAAEDIEARRRQMSGFGGMIR